MFLLGIFSKCARSGKNTSVNRVHDSRKIFPSDNSGRPLHSVHGGGGARRLLGVLSLVLAQGLRATLGPPVQDGLAVLVHLQLDDDQLAGVDAHIDGGSVGLLPLDPLNVDPELLPVALDYLAHLLPLVVTSHNLQVQTAA